MDIRIVQARGDADVVGVRLRIGETGEPIAGVAPDTEALLSALFVEPHADGEMEGSQPFALELCDDSLYRWLVADGRVLVGPLLKRLGRILAPLPVHFVELFRLLVVGLEVPVFERPGGGDAAVVLDLFEVPLPQAEERRPVEFGIAADKVVGSRDEFLPLPIDPRFAAVVAPLLKNSRRVPVLFFPREKAPSLDDPNLFSLSIFFDYLRILYIQNKRNFLF